MPKTIRIRTDIGQNTSKQLNVNLEQDFDFLEILSLKLLQSDVYIKQCSDYGVIVGRVLVNNGYGIPNAKISVFIPLQEEDEDNPIITAIYPYKTVAEVNEDGYRYNLLPYEPSYPGHQATGTFPKREDALTNKTAVQLFDKYYKFTVQTNESGDFMIFGVPIGTQTLVMDVDLSDIGEFSQSPQDLIRIGLASPNQIDGTVFKTSENLNILPQIINVVRTIEVAPFWGDPELCQIAITRADFDLGLEANFEIQPTSIFMGSLISTPEEQAQKRKCKVNKNAGNQCSLVSGPGQIKAIRHTIFEDALGRPSLEPYNFENDGNLIDENGTWLVDVPMNMDYITTDEFGQRIISNDPKIGVPSSAKYRFKIKWQQQPTLSEPVKRGYFLVPNIREYGWNNSFNDPSEDEFANNILNDTQQLQFATLQNSGIFSVTQTVPYLFLIPNSQKAVVKVINTTNVSDYFFTLNGVPITQKDNIIVDNNDTLTVTITFDDRTQQLITGYLSVNFEPYEKFQVERSYSFSLSWDDYADEQAAINCEDTFYEMRYNKVYTVSQIIDQYRKGFSNTKFLSIKDITDDNCQSTSNPFPTNDAQYKSTTLYLLFSFMTLIFKPILFVLLIISHVVAFLLKYIMYPLVVVIAVIFLIVILLCNVVKGIASIFGGGDNINCPDFGDLRDLVRDLLQLWKKMIIRLPNLTYPDCDICDCIDEDAEDYADDPYAQQSSGLTQNAPSGLIYEFSNIYQYKNIQNETGNYICCPTEEDCDTDDWEDDSDICNAKVLAVQVSLGGSGGPAYSSGGPNVIDSDSPSMPKRGWFSTSLPIAERINLFNAKSKFFQSDGINRIRVSFEPDQKPTSDSSLSHEDNVVIIVIDKNQISQYTPGQLISFQDSNLSGDINVRNLVTGQTTTGSTQISVPFAKSSNPNGGNSTRNYVVNITGSTTPQVKFPMDLEYYQVIYATPLVDMRTDSTQNNNSFFGKVFLQGNYLNRVNYSFVWNLAEFLEMSPGTINGGKYPYELIEGWEDLGVLVMVRGVDPHTPKVDIQYDISNLFGQPVGTKTVRGDFHLNIPIQSGYQCVRHQEISNNNSIDGIGKNLYFKTFNPLNIDQQKFTGYSTNLHSYYVSLDSTTYTSIPEYIPSNPNDSGFICGRGIIDTGINGIIIKNNNINQPGGINSGPPNTPNAIGSIYANNGILPTTPHSETGYLLNEKVEGCSYAHLSFWGITYGNNFLNGNREYGVQGVYHSVKYPVETTMNIEHSPQSRYVMRSDRLPTSTYDYPLGGNHMALQQNTGFSIYKISEDGTFASSGSFPGGGGYTADSGGDNVPDDENPAFVNEVLQSFTCGEENSTLVPFGCYEYNAIERTIVVGDTDVCTFKNPGNVQYFKNNCYQMVTKPLISLPVDVLTLTEWLSRIKIFFGLCQGVFRHMFTNSWINGTLFAFSFKNDRFFDVRYNRPYNKTCKDTVYFHRPTNNFFYRSSPYDNTNNIGNFIGRNSPQPLLASILPGVFDYFGGNMKNLMFPTTLMDLGPRDEISKFLSQSASDEYEGYVVNKTPTTTFNEIDEILNLFIISRLGNSNFLQQFFGGGGANILSYFTREKSVNAYYQGPYDYNVKNKNMVDSDYAQLISINSEFGIVPFDIENYPSNPNPLQQETIYFNGDPQAGDAIIGIFFSSYTQNRDFISPKRIIYNQSAQLGANSCNLNPIPIRDQRVPFYQWTIENNNDSNNIFGTQKGHWYTVGISGGTAEFYSFNYQSLDRLTSQSRFFRTQSTAQADFYKGYIYSVDTNTGIITADSSFTAPETILNGNNVVTAGGPFFFYFGLNRGASAMDRFMTKWVNTDNAVD